MTRHARRCVALSLALFSTAAAPPARAAGVTTETVSTVPLIDGTRIPRVVLGGFRFDSQNRPVVSWYLDDPAGSDITTAAYWSRKEAGGWNAREFWRFCCLLGTHSHATTVGPDDTPRALYAAPTQFDGYGVYRSNLGAFPDGSGASVTEGTDNYRTPRAQNNVFVPDVAADAGSPSYARALDRQLGVMSADLGTLSLAGREISGTEFDYVASSGGRHHVLYSPWIGGTSLPMTDGVSYWDGTDGSAGVRVPSASDGTHLRPALGLDRGADGTLHAVVNRTFGELGNFERYLFHYTSADGGNNWTETLLAGHSWAGLHTPPGFGGLALRNVVPVEVDIAVDSAGTPWIAYVTSFDDPSNPLPNDGGGINDFGIWLAHPEGGSWTHQRVASFASDGNPVADVKLAIDRDGLPALFFHHKNRQELVIGRAANAPPVLVDPGDQTSSEGDSVSLPLSASDPDADALTFSATGLPPGLALDSATGVVSGTLGFDSSGDYAVSIDVSDGVSSASVGFSWTVLNVQDLPVDLSAETRDSPDPVDAGGLLRYVVTVGNRGATRASGVVVAAQLPEGVAFEQATPAPSSQAGGVLSFDVGALAAGATRSASIAVRTGATGPLAFRVDVTASEPELNPDDNVSLAETQVLAASCFPSPDGLAGFWHADGDAFDAVSGVQGQPEGGLGFAPGKIGQAFDFDGIDDAVEVSDSPGLRITDTVSIAFWAKRQRFGVDIVLEKGGDWTGGQTNYGAGLHEANERMFYFFFAGGWRGAPGVADLDWHHYAVVATHGDANPRLFIDGVELAPSYGDGAATINLNPSPLPLHLGAQLRDPNNFTYYGQLLLDSVQIYDRALTPGEIAADAAAPARRECGGTNHPPVVAAPAERVDTEGDVVSIPVVASDPDGDSLTFAVNGTTYGALPPGIQIDPQTGIISGTLGPSSAGTYLIYIEVSDGQSTTTSDRFDWHVAFLFEAPTPQDDQAATPEDTPVTIEVLANDTDPDGDALSVEAVGVPAHGTATFDADGSILYSPAPNYNGPDEFAYGVRDPSGRTATATVQVTVAPVDDPPALVNPGAQSNVEGDDVRLELTATDPDGDPLTYSAAGLPAGLALDPGTGVIIGTPALDAAGSYQVTVSVSDGRLSESAAFEWLIRPLPIATQVTLTSSLNPSGFGQAVTFTAIVTASGSPATEGAVTFREGNQVLSGPTPLSGGQASFPTASLSAGSHVIQADYDGGSGFLPGSASTTQVVSPALSIGDVTVVEGKGGVSTATFTVTLSPASSLPVSVRFATANGTALAGLDYVPRPPTTLLFPAGSTTRTISVGIVGDRLSEATESFFVNLSAATHAVIADGQGVGTITDDDPLPRLSISDVTRLEGDRGRRFRFAVRLSAPSGQPVSVAYATVDESATAGSDYEATGGTLTFAPGSLLRFVTVSVVGDATPEPDETFGVTLANASGAQLVDTQARATILNDDGFLLSIADASTLEGNAGPTPFIFTATLTPASPVPLTVAYRLVNGSAEAGSDYVATPGIVRFAAGETSAAIRVVVVGDTSHEPDETFSLHPIPRSGVSFARPSATGTVLNDDPAPLVLTIHETVAVADAIRVVPPVVIRVTETIAVSDAPNPAVR